MENLFDYIEYKSSISEVDEQTIQQFEGILPDELINEWKNRGFSYYLNGLLLTVNPTDYYEIIIGFNEGKEKEKCHVVFRSVFGEIDKDFRFPTITKNSYF